jgi:hypothetical protein
VAEEFAEELFKPALSRPFIPEGSRASSKSQVFCSEKQDAVFIGIIEFKQCFILFLA